MPLKRLKERCTIKRTLRPFIKALASLSIPANSSLETIGNNAFTKAALSAVSIPAGVTELGINAFLYNEKLSAVTFAPGSSLKTIGAQAFWSAAITRITIPEGVTGIGDRAFRDTALITVTVLAEHPPTLGGDEVFLECGALASILVPAASVDAYRAAPRWDTYAEIISAIQ